MPPIRAEGARPLHDRARRRPEGPRGRRARLPALAGALVDAAGPGRGVSPSRPPRLAHGRRLREGRRAGLVLGQPRLVGREGPAARRLPRAGRRHGLPPLRGQRPEAPAELAERIGLAWQGGRSKFRHGPLDLGFPRAPTPDHRRLPQRSTSSTRATGSSWATRPTSRSWPPASRRARRARCSGPARHGKGRVFCSIPGHYTWTFDDPLFRILILRGIAWTAGEPVDRFNELVTVGATPVLTPARP